LLLNGDSSPKSHWQPLPVQDAWVTKFNTLRHYTKYMIQLKVFVCLMVFSATSNNISVISWRSDLLVRKPKYLEKTTDLSQVTLVVRKSIRISQR
jgi:hypothetical protein